ncbi:MAG: ATP-binding protein [Syntrophobacteraceae bacterium]
MTRQPDARHNPISDEDLFRGKLKKLLLFRLSLAVFFLLLTLAVTSGRKEDLLSSQLYPLYIFSCILFAFTIFGAWNLNRVRRLIRFAWVQLLFDIGAVTVLVYLSGGVESPFSFLYILVIISSALLLYRRGSLLAASACALVYGLLLDLQYFGWIAPLQIVSGTGYARDSGTYFFNILINIAGFYLVGFLAGYLAEEVLRSSRQASEHERDLRRLSTLHQSIVQSMTSGLLTVDSEGRVALLNNAGKEILGLGAEAPEGRPISELLPGIDIARFPGVEPSPDRMSRPSRMEIAYRSPSGEEVSIGYSASVLLGQLGEPFGWILIFRDLTQLKAIEEHMQRTERLAFAGRIAAEIAHEIKNPLAAMSGAVQMLRGEIGEDDFRSRLMGIVEREIERINELVTEFLWLAKGSPKSEQVEDVSVCATIRDILSLLETKNQVSESHHIRTEFGEVPLLTIDPHHLRQVLWNLFTNAVEAMPDGGELSVVVGGCEESPRGPREIRIDVADTGAGMPEGVRQRIFDPFFTTKASGTGLGLSIVYQLVEKAGGRIEANSNPSGRGMIFTVFFPPSKNFLLAK